MQDVTVLIADDEPYLTQVVSYGIQKAGARVLVARNGSEACALAREHLPDVIVIDYQMPVMDGIQASAALRADPLTQDIPVLLLTARGHKLTPSELARTGIRCMLPKPFSTRELVARIEELLAPAPAAGKGDAPGGAPGTAS